MSECAAPEGADTLLPNALLIVAAIDARFHFGETSSPKSDELLGRIRDAAWVHRHGGDLEFKGWRDVAPDANELDAAMEAATPFAAGEERVELAARVARRSEAIPYFANLSLNGHCSLTREGVVLARLLQSQAPEKVAPERCNYCGSPRVGDIHGCRQLYACGKVMQWCPNGVPGLPLPEIPPRRRKAQHQGEWFVACWCGEHSTSPRHGRAGHVNPPPQTCTVDDIPLVPGLQVAANRHSGDEGRAGETWASANGTVLVDWPAVDGRPAKVADIVPARCLVSPGGPDDSALSDYQRRLWAAISSGAMVPENNGDGTWGGRLEGRSVVPRAMAVLIECRLLEPAPLPRTAV